MMFLSLLSIAILKASLNVITPQNWSIMQNLTDAALTYEVAYAQKIPFADLLADDSAWPEYPNKVEEPIILGSRPGGSEIQATVVRTRQPTNAISATIGNGSELTSWKLQSHILFKSGGRDYIKSRTIIRVQ